MTDQLTPAVADAATTWVQVTEELWVASAGGEFVGTIERVEDRYIAVDGHGTPIGVNGALEGAKARFDDRPKELGLPGLRLGPFARLAMWLRRRRYARLAMRRGAATVSP
ncbi:hypothetical protein [Pseudolysinimonas sp.]|uniref:hypothetical protein n=1 Tax=Pseudolysinimonas sp. TaxID=2680009 RepID=UPI003F7D6D58